jgi:hypothetical protein
MLLPSWEPQEQVLAQVVQRLVAQVHSAGAVRVSPREQQFSYDRFLQRYTALQLLLQARTATGNLWKTEC